MWILRNSKSDQIYSFLVGTECNVGRKGCPILITDDQSISRKHATFSVSHSEANLSHPERLPTITLKDSSKYGTLINKNKVEANSTSALNHGDEIEFGSLGTNLWRVEYRPLVCAGSALTSAEKKSLKVCLLKLGGHYVSNWSKECTHLVMSAINVTIKVICALVSCCPIVTMEYLNKLVEAIESYTSLPDSTVFLPGIIEVNVRKDEVSFHPNPLRKSIFKNKMFIFLTEKKYKSLSSAVLFGGGKCTLMAKPTKDVEILTKAGTCVIHCSPDEDTQAGIPGNQQWASRVNEILQQNGLRQIQDQEIGLAVLYCSTKLHCNPEISQRGHNLMQPPMSQSQNTQVILAPETQTPDQGSKRVARTKPLGEKSFIDETRIEKIDHKKRSREEDTHCQSPSKIARIDSTKYTSKASEPNSKVNKEITLKPTGETSLELGNGSRKKHSTKTGKQSSLSSFLQQTSNSTVTKVSSDVDTGIQNQDITSTSSRECVGKKNIDVPSSSSNISMNIKTKSSKFTGDSISEQEASFVHSTSGARVFRKDDVTLEVPPTNGNEKTPTRKETNDTDEDKGMWKKKIKIEPTFEVESPPLADTEDQHGRPKRFSDGFISVQAQVIKKILLDSAAASSTSYDRRRSAPTSSYSEWRSTNNPSSSMPFDKHCQSSNNELEDGEITSSDNSLYLLSSNYTRYYSSNDNNYRRRYTDDGNIVITTKNYIIGDSMLKHININGLSDTGVKCMRGAVVREIFAAIKCLDLTRVVNVVVHAGTNDCSRADFTVDKLCNDFHDLISHLKQTILGKVFVSSICPRSDNTMYNDCVTIANDMLRTEYSETFIDHSNVFMNNNIIDSTKFTRHGLHLNKFGTSFLVNSINRTLPIILTKRQRYLEERNSLMQKYS